MNDHDVETLLRAALHDRSRALVPDGATPARTPAGLDRPAGATARRPRRGPRGRRIWWASGLVAAAAVAVIAGAGALSSEVQSQRPAPAASATPDDTPGTAAVSSPVAVPSTRVPSRPVPASPAGGEAGAATSQGTAPGGTTAGGDEIAVRANCVDPGDDAPAVRPAAIALACADNGENLVDLQWTTWTGVTATGTGSLVYRTCDPDCATGTMLHRVDGVSVTLSDPVTSGDGTRFWTRLTVAPDPVSDGSYDLSTSP